MFLRTSVLVWMLVMIVSPKGCASQTGMGSPATSTITPTVTGGPPETPPPPPPSSAPPPPGFPPPTNNPPPTEAAYVPLTTKVLKSGENCWQSYVVEAGNYLALRSVTSGQGIYANEVFVFPGFSGDCGDRNEVFNGSAVKRVKYRMEHVIDETTDMDNDAETASVVTSETTGKTTITPKGTGNYTFRFTAYDNPVDVDPTELWYEFTVVVIERGAFAVDQNKSATCPMSENWLDKLQERFDNMTGSYDLDDTCSRYTDGIDIHAPGCTVDDYFFNLRRGDDVAEVDEDGNMEYDTELYFQMKKVVTYLNGTLSTDTTMFRRTFVYSEEGGLSIALDTIGNVTVTLQAKSGEDNSSPVLDLASISYLVNTPDTFASTCGGHGVAIDDKIAQNGLFTCQCKSGYESTHSSPSSNPKCVVINRLDLIGSVTGVVALVIIVIIIMRIQMYRIKNKPIDVSAIQLQLLADLGLAVTADMKETEVGVNISIVASSETTSELVGQPLEEFKVSLLKLILKKLKIVAKDVGWVQPGPSPVHQFVVVVPKQPIHNESKFAHAVSDLDREMQAGNLKIDEYRLTSAGVACPQRTPREVTRSSVMRIDQLGEGNFSEVFKGELSEVRHHHTLKIIVAAKSLHAGSPESTRENLLKEAALMALFDHRNVCSLVGIVTTPRDLSVLLLMAYAENGCLLDFVRDRNKQVEVHTKLTFCAEVARGMDYVSARRVVHRDLAARNILLDISMVCKVGDFGLATALNESKEYARFDSQGNVSEELPVRWAAPEIFQDSKFSTQSDVWSFGVLAWEVFSNGKLPYDHLTVIEVVQYVRNGGSLTKIVDCPEEVFKKLILDCCVEKPQDRPTFSNLYEEAIYLGGSEDETAIKEKKVMRNESMSSTTLPLTEAERLKRQGPSVHHLTTVFLPESLKAVHANRKKFPVDKVSEARIFNVVDSFVKPAGVSTICPRDGKMGAAYVDTLKGANDVGVASALLSYSWGYKVEDVVSALNAWTKQTGNKPKRTYIWICSLCLNQHRIAAVLSPDQLQQEFGERVMAIGRVLPMLENWEDPGYVKRAWCLFELYTAVRMNSIEVDIILTPEQREQCANEIRLHGFKVIDRALNQVKSENATATQKADLDAIRALILRFHGGFQALDRAVCVRLRTWFQTIAGIRFASVDMLKSNSVTTTSSNDKHKITKNISLNSLSPTEEEGDDVVDSKSDKKFVEFADMATSPFTDDAMNDIDNDDNAVKVVDGDDGDDVHAVYDPESSDVPLSLDNIGLAMESDPFLPLKDLASPKGKTKFKTPAALSSKVAPMVMRDNDDSEVVYGF